MKYKTFEEQGSHCIFGGPEGQYCKRHKVCSHLSCHSFNPFLQRSTFDGKWYVYLMDRENEPLFKIIAGPFGDGPCPNVNPFSFLSS